MSFSLGLRRKVILLASFFLILPWLGYQYVLEIENFLRQGQEQTLIGTTRAVATALHERPKLFNTQASFLNQIEDGKDLYAYDLKAPITIDGKLDDWQTESSKSLVFAKQKTIYQRNKNTTNPISFEHMVGTQGKYLYSYLKVTDKYPVYRADESRFFDKNDHLIIALSTPQNKLQRYIVSVQKSGWFNGYLLVDESNKKKKTTQGFWQDTKQLLSLESYLPDSLSNQPQREKRIQGYWQRTDTGYNIEFRLPISMLGDKLGFALHTTSNAKTGEANNIIATSDTNDLKKLGTILVPSPEIEQILKGLSHSQSRLWVVDKHQRVLASSGNIHQADGVWANNNQSTSESSWWSAFKDRLIKPIYKLILSEPNNTFIDELHGSTQLNSEFIKQALSGQSQSSWRLTSDNKAMILSAASPIFVGDKVMGMVVAEETTNGIRTLRNQALEKLFNIVIAVIVVGTLLLFFFTANIASRIGKLRDQAENAIDEQGRVSAPFAPSNSSDEIGDLSRSLSDMVNRLGQYHRYLENLASRLSHELGTPVAVVRSSLENLSLLPQDEASQKYIERSQTGILRLNRILTNMSEATRLEQSLQNGEKINVSLNELLNGCVQGYQMTYDEYQFGFESLQADSVESNVPSKSKDLIINADPDFMVQCLDKLVKNAMEFSAPSCPIHITLMQEDNMAIIKVKNSGPLLPDNMSDELLNSMVSIRKHNSPDQTHLGLGLFIAKMICDFHHGKITIKNNDNEDGVSVTLCFPLIPM